MSDFTTLKLVSSDKCFNGYQNLYQHASEAVKCDMKFSVFLPSSYNEATKLPVLIFLSGFMSDEQNFITKCSFQKYAEENSVIVVGPDTSPRGLDFEGFTGSFGVGESAGFYVDATEEKWKTNFRMYSYVNDELHQVIKKNFSCDASSFGIFGFSMGGHGAIISFLRNPNKYKSCSAFAPLCNPSECPFQLKAFAQYLGSNGEVWKEYDATHLAKHYKGRPCEILIDQGAQDVFLKMKHLMPDLLAAACEGNKDRIKLLLNYREGYDHTYYFIATFIEDHIKFHAKFLNNK